MTILIPPEHIQEEQEILGQIKRGERIDHYETIRVDMEALFKDLGIAAAA